MTAIKWLKEPGDSMWDREAAKLRAQPRVEQVLDVESSNPSTHKNRINAGVLAAFKDPDGGRYHARVVDGRILAYYEPPEQVTLGADQPLGDDDP